MSERLSYLERAVQARRAAGVNPVRTYLTQPFAFALPGFETRELEPR